LAHLNKTFYDQLHNVNWVDVLKPCFTDEIF